MDLEQFSNNSETLEYLNINNIQDISGNLSGFDNLKNLIMNIIESIDDYMFENNKTLPNIEANNAKYIGYKAFYNSGIDNVNNFKGIISVSSLAFGNCNNLIEIKNPFSSSVKYGNNVFDNCDNLEYVELNNLNNNNDTLFTNCNNIEKFIYSGNVSNNNSLNMVLDSSNSLLSYQNNIDTVFMYNITDNFKNIENIILPECINIYTPAVYKHVYTQVYKYAKNFKYSLNGSVIISPKLIETMKVNVIGHGYNKTDIKPLVFLIIVILITILVIRLNIMNIL